MYRLFKNLQLPKQLNFVPKFSLGSTPYKLVNNFQKKGFFKKTNYLNKKDYYST